jgi:hypothetical protein
MARRHRESRRAWRRDRRRDRHSGWADPAIVFGVVLVLLGALILLNNAGLLLLDWGVTWPLLVIAAGLVIMAGAFMGRGADAVALQSVTIPAEDARRLELTLRLGAGRYALAAGTAELVDVTANEPSIESQVDRLGDLARVRLSPAAERWGWTWHGGFEWRIAVARDIPTMLDVRAGAGDFALDLTDVSIVSAQIGIGAAELRVVLPRPRGDVPIRVEGGAASMTFQVPPEVEARVTTSGLVTMSGRSETPGYATAADRVTVTVTGGAASVRVA